MHITILNAYQRPALKKDQNSHIDIGAKAFERCKEWLKAEGFTITKVEIGEHVQPLILIHTCAKCAWLERTHGAYGYKLFPVMGSRATMMRADIFGCRVEWVERGH